MAMLVKELARALRLVPDQCMVRARIPRASGVEVRSLERIGQHNRDDVHPEQPVELFVDTDGKNQMTAGDAKDTLKQFPDNALVRIAVQQASAVEGASSYHRCLDIETVGFSSDGDEEYPPAELHTENWESMSPIIRMDDHTVGDDLGDRSYVVEGGRMAMTIVGRSPG